MGQPNVYKLHGYVDKYQTLTTKQTTLFQFEYPFDGTPLGGVWPGPIEMVTVNRDPRKVPFGDYLGSISSIPIFTSRAVEVLGDLLDGNGELLPVHCEGKTYFAYNVTCLIDALDEERSQLDRFSTGRVMLIQHHEFRADALKDAVIFKLPQFTRGSVFVTDVFAARVEQAGLEGFNMEHVFGSSPRAWLRPSGPADVV